MGGSVKGKTIAILGLTFKPNTDDMRDSPSLSIVAVLQGSGARIKAFDPAGMAEAKKLLPDITYCDDAYGAIDGADAVVIVTEWNEFRVLDLPRVRKLMRAPLIIDLRNIYSPAEMAGAGFAYHSIGRTSLAPAERKDAL
jgi:UDPglucose 6-dehydrogenase